MRPNVRVVTPPPRSASLIKYASALVSCLIAGYSTHMIAPHVAKFISYLSQPTDTNPFPKSSGTEPNVVFTPIEAPAREIAPAPKSVNGTYTKLAACRIALQANHGYGGFSPAEAAAIAVSRVGAMSPGQIKEVCRLITEGLVTPPR